MSYPSIIPDNGDTIIAVKEQGLGTMAEKMKGVDSIDTTVSITLEGDTARGDTYRVTVNGQNDALHIDTITNLIAFADTLMYYRN